MNEIVGLLCKVVCMCVNFTKCVWIFYHLKVKDYLWFGISLKGNQKPLWGFAQSLKLRDWGEWMKHVLLQRYFHLFVFCFQLLVCVYDRCKRDWWRTQLYDVYIMCVFMWNVSLLVVWCFRSFLFGFQFCVHVWCVWYMLRVVVYVVYWVRILCTHIFTPLMNPSCYDLHVYMRWPCLFITLWRMFWICRISRHMLMMVRWNILFLWRDDETMHTHEGQKGCVGGTILFSLFVFWWCCTLFWIKYNQTKTSLYIYYLYFL